MVNAHKTKQEICEIGRRIYAKGFAAANDGNISVRISENEVLCTPTLQCKGFLTPDDITTVDMSGKQIAGRKKMSSEALLHLEIYKQRADIKSVVHCHPPHATAFAVAREPIPQCVLPEVEVFLGDVPIARYETPGGQAFADTILPFVHKSNIMLLANHGTVSYGETVERAYWWTEILDAYCRILLLSHQLGRVQYVGEQKERELLDLRFKRINYNPSVVEKIYERMVSERQQIASKFRSEGEGEAARILGNKERDLDKIESEAYREVQTIRGAADAKATEIYARAYNQTAEAAELYEFVKSMETYKTVIGRDATLVLSTDSDLFRYLKRAGGPPLPLTAPQATSGSEP
jgi:L-fuculose-phosphate aldolase